MKKKKPLVWIIGALVVIGIVGGIASDGDSESSAENSADPSVAPIVSAEPSYIPSEEPSPSESPSEEPSPSEEQTSSPVVTVTYIASSTSNKCHTERCRFAGDIAEENIIYFHSKEDAVNAGYSACGTCKPW